MLTSSGSHATERSAPPSSRIAREFGGSGGYLLYDQQDVVFEPGNGDGLAGRQPPSQIGQRSFGIRELSVKVRLLPCHQCSADLDQREAQLGELG
jgi:hypothetical protein